MLEKDIQLQILKYLRARGFEIGKTKTMGVKRGRSFCFDPYLFRGFPDLTYFYHARFGFIEVKAPGNKQSAEQIRFEALCKTANIPYLLAYDLDDVIKVFG